MDRNIGYIEVRIGRLAEWDLTPPFGRYHKWDWIYVWDILHEHWRQDSHCMGSGICVPWIGIRSFGFGYLPL